MIIGDSMDYITFIDEIVEKYGYEDNVRRAIEIAIPLMIKKYGEERLEEVLNVFKDVRIFVFNERTEEVYETIQKEMEHGINVHLKDETKANYGNDFVPGSGYTYQAIYDEDMNVTGEVKWISVEALTDSKRLKYEETFGTNINIPYFLHELGHAFAMQNPTYKKEGNKIFSKHGFYETIDEISYVDGVPIIRTVSEEGLLIEDIVNEKMTKEQLMDYFGLEDEESLHSIIANLGSSNNIYGGSLNLLAEQFEKQLGTDNILKWRIDNDKKIKENFSCLCEKTKIASVYFPGENAYSFFANKCIS